MKIFHVTYVFGWSKETSNVIAKNIDEALKKAKRIVKEKGADEVLSVVHGGEVDA